MQFPTEVPIGGNSSSDTYGNNQLQQRRRPDHSYPASLLNPGSLQSGYQQPSTPTSPAVMSGKGNENKTSDAKEITADRFIRKQIQTIRNELNLLISVPFILLVGYGGRPSLLILSFGSLACYILDILEAVEGTLIAFFLTMIMFLGSLIYATSDALQESFYNIILLPTFIIAIIIFFIVGTSHFNFAFNESSILMNLMIQIIFAVSPLLFGSLVSAILCDDILDFDLQTCFTFLYFLYTWYYCRPRFLYRLQYKKVGSKITTPYSDMKRQLMIPSIVMPIIYLLPIIISFLLQLSLHHNVLTSERHRIIGIMQSILLPALLMCFTYQQHEKHAQELLKDSSLPGDGRKEDGAEGGGKGNEDIKIVAKWVFRLLLGLYIILNVESHPFFDEMKHFAHFDSSSSSAYTSSIENLLFSAMILLLFIIYLLMEKLHEYQSNDLHSSLSSDYDDISPYNTSKQLPDLLKEGFGVKTRFQLHHLILRLALDGSIGCVVGLVAYLFNFPRSVVPIAVIGSVSMMELHFFHDPSAFFSRFILAMLALTSTSLTMITFTKGTVYYLLYSFHSYFYGSFQLSQFSWIVTILMCSAIILPLFLRNNGAKRGGKDAPYETFSFSHNSRSNNDDIRAKGIDENEEEYGDPKSLFFSAIFSTGLIVFMLIVTWLELTMMEQDWSGLEVTEEIVYPTYFFILTMVLSGWIGFMLYSHRSIGFTTFGNILMIQITKLLHFFHHSSYIIIPLSILLISNLLPFFRQYSYYQRYVVKYQQTSFDDLSNTRQKKNNNILPFISWNEVIVYLISNAVIYYLFSANLSRWLLRQLFSFFNNTFTASTEEEVMVVGSRAISRWQVLFFSLAMFVMYVSSILFVFQRKQKSIRSILMGVSILLVIISFEGFGLLRLNDATDDVAVLATNTVNGHFLSAYDHSTFFMLMTFVMTLIAWSRLIALDSMLTCFFYSLIFGFISTKAMINWAFPYQSLVTHPYYDQHHHHHHNHHMTSASSQQVYYYPFCFLFVLKVLNTFIALWNPKNSSHSLSFTTLFPLLYIATLLWPLVNLIISLVILENQDVSEMLADLREREEIGASAGRETDLGTTLITNKTTIYTGIILSTLVGHLMLTASFRLKEVLNYMRDPRETIYSSRIIISFLFSNSSTHQGSAGGYPLVLFHAFVTLAWGVLVILFGMTSIDYDIFFPIVSAILLLYDNEIEVERIPFFASCFRYALTNKRKVTPWQLWTLINVAFWLISFFYHTFVMDFPLTSAQSSLDIDSSYYKHLLYLTRIKPYSWLNFDSNVSIWSSESALTPALNVMYLLFALPAIYYSIWNASTYAVNKTNQYTTQMTGLVSDDVMFLLSVLTLVPLIGANVDCLRYLALIGGLHGVYRSNYLFKRQRLSNDYL